MSASVFRQEALDLLIERFPDDERVFRKPSEGDAIAQLLHLALEMVARTGRSLRRAAPGGKRDLGEGAGAFSRPANVDFLVRLRDLIDEDCPEQVMEESVTYLDFLRRAFRTRVRGLRPDCWEALQSGADRPAGECALRETCRENNPGAEPPPSCACDLFHDGWRRTSLAIEPSRPGSIAELEPLIREACPGLGLLADRDMLRRSLEAEFGRSPGARGGKRTVRGRAVRLCTDLVEHCLADLSARHRLPEQWRLSLLA